MSDLEVRTRSIATAGAIVAAGHEPVRLVRRDGHIMFCFAPEAEEALHKFLRAKARLDQMVEEGE